MRRPRFSTLSFLVFTLGAGVTAAEVPTPESSLGFKPGADFHLAGWSQVVSYFHAVDAASDRVSVRVLGESTEGRPYLAAVISSPDTIASLDQYQDFQACVQLHGISSLVDVSRTRICIWSAYPAAAPVPESSPCCHYHEYS